MSIRITDDSDAIDLERVMEFLVNSGWQSGIGRRTLKTAVENSICFSAFDQDRQVGFARVVTDRATFAWVDDVYVDPEYRGQGIAGTLIESIVNHPRFGSVATWFLSTTNPDARKVFNRFGFAPLSQERSQKIMARPKVKNERYRA